ncbi:MAG: DNA internalization-related competence protein ComEC/Rec2 [Gemmatimonadetes bacterium 13_1_40CM_4_69_8]|nr:MAG: DNA internalization-related competence protein ComEC/Rec2 [Gemmatimonadetes bacterium 13_1_40CM_4_69_8]
MRPPILWITVGFGAGVFAGLSPFMAGSGVWGGGMALSVLLGAAVLWRSAPVGAAFGVAIVAGVVWGAGAVRLREQTCAGRWTGQRETGMVRSALVRLQDPVAELSGLADGVVEGGSCGGALRIRWPEGHAAAGGTAWVVAGRWLGDGDRGVLVARRMRELDAVPRGRGALRDRIARRAAALFGARAPLVEALVTARRAELDPALRERFARAGLAHLLVISGLHVGFFAAWLALLLRRLRLPLRARLGGELLVLLGYLWLLGFPPPATRAAVMLAVAGVARLRQRVVAPRGTIALAALAVVLVDPWAVHAVGAWLSVAAVAAVVWAGRATVKRHRLVRLVAPAAAATILTAPITAYAFGTVAPIGVLANLVAIPLAGIAVPGLLLALLLAGPAPALGSLLAAGSGLGLALLDGTARIAAAVPGGHLTMVAGLGAAGLWAGVAVMAWWLWHAPRRPWLIAARSAFVLTILVFTSLFGVVALDDCRCLSVHFLDVGQGDGTVLRTPAGRWVVIDGGPRTPERDAGRRVVVPFLRRAGATAVAVVVATHGDADHLGGVPAVLEAFPPALVLEPGEPLGRPLYLEFLGAVEASGATWHAARAGDRFTLDGVTLEVLSPDSAWMATPVEVNEHGVVLRVTFGDARLLFQADAGLPVEARLAGRVGPVTVLKVGHHGSRTATSDAWLEELRPGLAVISVGAHNNYGHPAPEVVSRLTAHGVPVLRTDRDGTITFDTDGQRAQHIDVSHHD